MEKKVMNWIYICLEILDKQYDDQYSTGTNIYI